MNGERKNGRTAFTVSVLPFLRSLNGGTVNDFGTVFCIMYLVIAVLVHRKSDEHSCG